MNKKILAAAIAATITAPMAVAADVTVYGKAHVSVVSADLPNGGQDTTDIQDTGSRLGFKGSEDLGNGLKANFQLEMEADWANRDSNGAGFSQGAALTAGSRNTYVGLSGDWGEFRVGRHDTPAKMAAGSLSTFHDQLGDVNQIANIQNVHSADAYAYISPNFSGFSFAVAGITGSQAATTAEQDNWAAGYSLAGTYNNGGLTLVAYYENRDDMQGREVTSSVTVGVNGVLSATTFTTGVAQDGNSDTWGLGARYKMDNMYVSAGYEEENVDVRTRATGVKTTDREDTSWYLEAGYTMGNTTLKGIYGDTDRDNKIVGGVDTDDSGWAIGVDHKLSKRTMLWAQYADSDTANVGNTNNNSGQSTIAGAAGASSAFQIGLSHSF